MSYQWLSVRSKQTTILDCVRFCYGWGLTNTPSKCSSRSKMDIQNAMSCKKGGFITIRHNDLRNMNENLLKELWKDVDIEPHLLPVMGEPFTKKTANTSIEAKLIYNKGNPEWKADKHSLMWGYFTQISMGISTKHSLNVTSKMNQRRNNNTMKQFEKLTMEVLPLLYSQSVGVWEESVSRFITI